MTATDVAPAAGNEVAKLSPEEQELIAAQHGSVDRSKLKLPALQVVNGLSAVADVLPLGHLYNSLDNEDFGESVDVIILGLYYGRFYSNRDEGRAYSARGEVAPDNWPEEYAGRHFTDIEDAEERWKEAVNAGEHPWGKGPPIQSTTNFVIVLADRTDETLRLSMKASDNTTAGKIAQTIDRQQAFHDFVWTIKSDKRPAPGGGNSFYFGFAADRQGKITPEQRSGVVAEAIAYHRASKVGAIEEVGDTDADASKPKKQATKGKGLGY